ncbi:MAG: hypothetical protein JO099_17540 [Acidobacteriia bacterium]|nr:hypothetical protein [Terriglobia bacterium]
MGELRCLGSVHRQVMRAGVICRGTLLLALVAALSRHVQAAPASYFVPMAPCRIVDTRTPAGPFGGPSLSGGTIRSFAIPNGACPVPSGATAYSLNVTVVPQGALGYLTIWPAGQAPPVVSTLNSLDGRVKANAAIVPAGDNGAVYVYATSTTDVILDVNGYFVPDGTPGALAFYPVAPCRVADTRNQVGALGGPSLAAMGTRSFPILTSTCGISTTAQAYSLNFTVVPQTTLGYLSVWPDGQPQPTTSALNDPTGSIVANGALVGAGGTGSVDVFASGPTDLVIDVNGYFASPIKGGLSFYVLTPCRVLDTREFSDGPITFYTVNVQVSPCGVPTSAQAYVLNATVVPSSFLGFLTLWPLGQQQPPVSTLNATDGAITSNLAIVPAAGGSISVFASNPTQLILDIAGYFAP